MWLLQVKLSWLSIQMNPAVLLSLLQHQVKPGDFGRDIASSTSCLLAWYSPLSSPGSSTSMSQAELQRSCRVIIYLVSQCCALSFVLKIYHQPSIGGMLEWERCLAKEFQCSPILRVRCLLMNLSWAFYISVWTKDGAESTWSWFHVLTFLLLESLALWLYFVVEFL